MARFAINMSVFAFYLAVRNFGVAPFAGLMSGVDNGERCDFSNGMAPVVAVLAEAVGHHQGAQRKEGDNANDEHHRYAEEMLGILHN